MYLVQVAGFLAALAICVLITGYMAQSAADTDDDSPTSRSGETSANADTNKASSESAEAKTSSSLSISSKHDSSNEPEESTESAELTAESESEALDRVDRDGESAEPTDDTDMAEPTDVDDEGDTSEPAASETVTAAPRDSVRAAANRVQVEAVAAVDEAIAPEAAAEEVGEVPPARSTAAHTQQRSAAAATTAAPARQRWWVRFQRKYFNKTPTVSFDSATTVTQQDGTITGAVIGHDADGDVLTYTAGPSAYGTVVMNADGTFVYTPGTNYRHESGDLFTVTVSDDNPANGFHVHGMRGLFKSGYRSTATTRVGVGGTVTAGTTAADRYGWGNPTETRFTSSSSLSNGWYVYDSPGHNGWGRRTPDAISFVNGAMVLTGDAAGNTAGLAWGIGQMYGAWEIRVKVPVGAADYHAVALLWPDAENWPAGGEIDFLELTDDASRQRVSHFLHYSRQNLQEYGSTAVDATEWHNYAVSWTPTAITIYIDGRPVFQSTDTSHFPPGAMHLAIQLDASERRPLDLSDGAQMMVAWARQYSLSAIS